MIKLENVFKTYTLGKNTINAIDNLSMEIKKGEFVAIVGPSGSGKSTLLHLIGGLDHPSKGNVSLLNITLAKLKDSKLAEYRNKHIGFVFQNFNLQPILTAAENVALPLVFANFGSKTRKQKALQALKKVGLDDRADHKPAELSGGESQRVAIARALVNDPQILIADEPTGNLDSKTGDKIMNLFKKLNREQNITVIIVTHNMEDAAFADRQIKMRDGVILKS
ncbi:ABC transporter ATP-binding protein [candidate division CPR3 bacterium GWF2_35_18]|uniref:ABC-type transporter, ATPase component n=1 Tax=candidate division CPR3 bacterium GW2011_GWF2_35_18 TaxID=1618350 RepID=A0A0G0BIE9_UNCC3|nr:MAG: ABC-type transporter, ATPase component [candidate division CPR3 bacterium GW2011_GWF2_35_18]KKP87104.1 MAG: ABC-type transporter, ATPase component [candidate division CPR3 bacterium GW2011_GWE2_35_7]OGB62487.1 MAG: ABC transporter ATP-binding protein [candidate division CPR3 bacterium GWF2_35_18]OGB65531.1 MAG: ABC transporter ATP-binding protein [candidate division CPR3 bacterium RIFOXYA2_FULL_35_13]OGB76199.1 MAG: ABC transporter ATP-binding protein [candidate division CPR3 bacterium 